LTQFILYIYSVQIKENWKYFALKELQYFSEKYAFIEITFDYFYLIKNACEVSIFWYNFQQQSTEKAQ
jgi:hypothetical protein